MTCARGLEAGICLMEASERRTRAVCRVLLCSSHRAAAACRKWTWPPLDQRSSNSSSSSSSSSHTIGGHDLWAQGQVHHTTNLPAQSALDRRGALAVHTRALLPGSTAGGGSIEQRLVGAALLGWMICVASTLLRQCGQCKLQHPRWLCSTTHCGQCDGAAPTRAYPPPRMDEVNRRDPQRAGLPRRRRAKRCRSLHHHPSACRGAAPVTHTDAPPITTARVVLRRCATGLGHLSQRVRCVAALPQRRACFSAGRVALAAAYMCACVVCVGAAAAPGCRFARVCS